MQATIKEVNQDNPKEVKVLVDFDNGKETVQKELFYTIGNLESKDQVLANIQDELNLLNKFQAIVEDLKTQIDVPIEAKLEIAGAIDV